MQDGGAAFVGCVLGRQNPGPLLGKRPFATRLIFNRRAVWARQTSTTLVPQFPKVYGTSVHAGFVESSVGLMMGTA